MAKRGTYKSTLRGYDAYVQAYEKRKEELRRKGLTMYERKYTKLEYDTTYTAIRNDRKREIREGKRKTVGDINRQMVNEQTYEYSLKQGRAMQKAIEVQTGNKYKIADIRAGVFKIDWNEIKYRREELKEQGKSTWEIKKIIGQEYFGSE